MAKEVVMEDKMVMDQMRLIQKLNEEEKEIVFQIIDKMLTNKKMNDFINEKYCSAIKTNPLTFLHASGL